MKKSDHVFYNLIDDRFLHDVLKKFKQVYPCSDVVQKDESFFMKALAKTGEKLKIFSSYRDFMERHSTTIGCTVYTNFDPHAPMGPEEQYSKAAVIAHEYVHVRQYRKGGRRFQARYLLDPTFRMFSEGEAYTANLGLLTWSILLGTEILFERGEIPGDEFASRIRRTRELVISEYAGSRFRERLSEVYRVRNEEAQIAVSIVLSKLLSLVESFAKTLDARSGAVYGLLPSEARVVADLVLERESRRNKGGRA